MPTRTTKLISGLIGLLFFAATSIALAAPTICQIGNGCTGTSTAPSYGKLLIGGQNGEYEFVASSTFSSFAPVQSVFGRTGAVTAQTGDYTTTKVTEGTNLYFTTARAQASVSALYPLIDTAGVFSSALGTTSSNTWGGTQTFTNAPILSSLTSGALAVDASGSVYKAATTTAGTGLQYSGGAFNVTGLTTTQFASANVSQWTNDAGYSTFPFTPTTFGPTTANSTSTLVGFTQGLYSLASSTIGNGTGTGGLTVSGNSTTTGMLVVTPVASGKVAIQFSNQGVTGLNFANNSFLFTISGNNTLNVTSSGFGNNTTNTGFAYNFACTSANPVWSFSSDSTSGLSCGSVGNVNIIVNSKEIFRFATSTVGVGTTTPFARFSVFANDGDTNKTLFAIGSSTNTSTSTLFVVANTGNVAIGSGAPLTRLLSVGGASNFFGVSVAGAGVFNSSDPNLAFTDTTGGDGDFIIDTNANLFTIQDNSGNLGTLLAISDLTRNTGISSTSPFALLSVHANNGDTNKTVFAVGSSTSNSTTTLFTISNQGDVNVVSNNGSGSLGFTVSAAGTNFAVTPNGMSISRTGTSNVSQFNVAGAANISAGGTYNGLLVNTNINNSGATPGIFNSFLVNPTLTLTASSTNLIAAYESASTTRGFFVNQFGQVGIGTSSPFAPLSIQAATSTPGNNTLFAISSTTYGVAPATTTLLKISNTGDATHQGNATTTLFINSISGNKGARLIMIDVNGSTCTEITTLAGAMLSKAVTCPPSI